MLAPFEHRLAELETENRKLHGAVHPERAPQGKH
jgi:hypothetical protein